MPFVYLQALTPPASLDIDSLIIWIISVAISIIIGLTGAIIYQYKTHVNNKQRELDFLRSELQKKNQELYDNHKFLSTEVVPLLATVKDVLRALTLGSYDK